MFIKAQNSFQNMTRYVAFLRGINVGGHNIIKNRNSLFVTHRVEELLLGMFVMDVFVRLRLDLGSWNCV